MQNDLIHAALIWHAAHSRRLAVSAEKRRLEKLLKHGRSPAFSPVYTQHSAAARQLTELKRRELALLRNLAKACAKQRGHLDTADIIDIDGAVTLLPAPAEARYVNDTTTGSTISD